LSLLEVQQTIERLSEEEQAALMAWLERRDRELWDRQIIRDFSPGGAGMTLLEQVDAEIDKGTLSPSADARSLSRPVVPPSFPIVSRF
jgi:hypothetical protein